MLSEFASGTMMRLIHKGLLAQGIAMPPAMRPVPVVELGRKQALLQLIEARHGLGPILAIGTHVESFAAEPTGKALLAAHDPGDLVRRWQRLERFVHSRHRVDIVEETTNTIALVHVSKSDVQPSHSENALVAGLLAGMFKLIGAKRLTLAIGEQPVWEDGNVRADQMGPETAIWQYQWARLDAAQPVTIEYAGAVANVRRLAASDCAKRWTISAMAHGLGLSVRSLQRLLEPEGGFAAAMAKARAEKAAEFLCADRISLAEIAFACGYSDQPHFNREFRRYAGMAPGQYRNRFGETSGAQERILIRK